MRNLLIFVLSTLCLVLRGQEVMTPELLWEVGRVSAIGISQDKKELIYKVTYPDIKENTFTSEKFAVNLKSGDIRSITEVENLMTDPKLSPDGTMRLVSEQVKVKKVTGEDFYPSLQKSNALIYDQLHYRHWDAWQDGKFNHIIIEYTNGKERIDIMEGEPFHSPTVPFGGPEDYIWSPEGNQVIYACKKLYGTDYVQSTNTDLYSYDLRLKTTVNLTEGNRGYDMSPAYSSDGKLAYLSMAREGYESDKNDIKVFYGNEAVNLTKSWDGTVNEFIWAPSSRIIYFTAPVKGTVQLFELSIPKDKTKTPSIKQITNGQFDLSGLVDVVNEEVIVGRMDMNRAKEYVAVHIKTGNLRTLTHVNDKLYSKLKLPSVEKRMVATTDGKQMLTWVIYPPDFDPSKKYPTLLYTQGGPQSALSQFYSFRWNFQVMASQGYIVVAPNRRGMPGYGVEWNEQISRDWGGQNMQDYLSAIDDVAKEEYVDKDRIGCVGASYGGFSAFYLAGIHEGRFSSFIAHDGIFNLRSMYGTTEELFFVNWDIGGPYWDEENTDAQKAYREFNPINRVASWDTPIMIIQGGKDFRVPDGQAFEAFTAAQLKGIKSRLLYFPEENHWVLSPQNGLVWQQEFFKWLEETL